MKYLLALFALLSAPLFAANNYVEINVLPATFNPTKDVQVVQVNVPGTLTLGGCTHTDFGKIVYVVNGDGNAPIDIVVLAGTNIAWIQSAYPYLFVCASSGWSVQ